MFTHLKRLDWVLNFAIIFLASAGLLSLLSTARNLFWFQLVWVVLGFGIMFAVSSFDWRPFITYKWFIWGIYLLAIIFLVITYLFAPSIRGVRAWLLIGPFQFQMSEFAKFALIIIFSSFFAKGHIAIAHVKNLALSFVYFLIPALLIIIQPDMGTALILFGIWFGYLLVSELRWKHILAALLIFMIVFAFMWTSVLEEYQKDRIIGLFNPESDPLGINYNVIQSKIAIGSAGFWGKGFMQGTQVQLGFLPEAQTDFIFSAFVEEWGTFGGLLIFAAFFVILYRIIEIGISAENNFGKFICLGVSILFLLHFILNIGSNLSLLPVIGVPFPFLSYGGSNMLINFLLIGIIQSIVVRKY